MTIEGLWNSRYEYGRGSNDEPKFSEHQIKFAEVDGAWQGHSLPSEDGSEVTINLAQTGTQFDGTWHERTSPTGHYQGREFEGLLRLLQVQSDELTGAWLGNNSAGDRVKHGEWMLERVKETGIN